MNKIVKILFGITFIIGIFFIPVFSFAESGIEVYDNDIEVQTWPEAPEPYKDVSIELTSYATDLNKAIIRWQVNNTTVLSGYGKTSYSMKAPGPDINTVISVTITPENSMKQIVKDILIKTSDIDLLWEAVDGYTPPFYKGKSFATVEGRIKVVAIPNSSTIRSGKGNISYKWKREDESDQKASGYSKDAYTFTNSILRREENIGVVASSVDGLYNGVKNIQIPIYSPKIVFYKKSPTEGVLYNKALNNNSVLSEDEFTIVAEPYFLAIKGEEGLFTYKWNINGDPIKTPSKKTELTIRPTAKGGYANISVTLESISKLFQKVTGALKISI